MQYALVFAGAALAQLANAQPHQNQHGRFHGKRAVETTVEIDYVTEVVTVTANGYERHWSHPHHSHATTSWSSAAEPSSAAPASIEAPISYSSAASSSVSVGPASKSSSAASSSTLVSSISSAPSPSAYTSSSAAAPSSYASTSSSAVSPSSSGISLTNLSPNGKKAGLSGYIGIQDTSAFGDFAQHISWYSDYTANTPDSQGVMGVGMLWAATGSSCGSVGTDRMDTFESMISDGTTPSIMFGFYEPDCSCPDSADMTTDSAASAWDSLIAPLADKGTILGSPSMCKQYDEDFLTPFNDSISTTWDVTSIHINKYDLEGAKKDVEYYVSTYGKPVWVSEFACVHDEDSWSPCTDQSEIDTYIKDVVSYFENNDDVVAYGPSNGNGLGDVWPLTKDGELTASGTTYLNAIKGV